MQVELTEKERAIIDEWKMLVEKREAEEGNQYIGSNDETFETFNSSYGKETVIRYHGQPLIFRYE
jgi:hypothetical protein